MVETNLAQSPILDFGNFLSSKGHSMIKVSVNPTWEWASNRRSRAIRSSIGPVSVKQTFLPRSLDFSLMLKYRR
jgi:hypothetical protein